MTGLLRPHGYLSYWGECDSSSSGTHGPPGPLLQLGRVWAAHRKPGYREVTGRQGSNQHQRPEEERLSCEERPYDPWGAGNGAAASAGMAGSEPVCYPIMRRNPGLG